MMPVSCGGVHGLLTSRVNPLDDAEKVYPSPGWIVFMD
jgi:hypothetical protein